MPSKIKNNRAKQTIAHTDECKSLARKIDEMVIILHIFKLNLCFNFLNCVIKSDDNPIADLSPRTPMTHVADPLGRQFSGADTYS